jgi:A/G-specific adenine glycosylase
MRPRSTAASFDATAFRKAVFAWFRKHGRHGLPWRREGTTPWHVMVSECMLQQTQVDRVAPKYEAFLAAWPTAAAFARAKLGDVLRAWSGLGYNRRAKNLHRAAEAIVLMHGGEVPADREALRALPGVGPYTVEAIRAFAFNTDAVVIDTNIRRIFARVAYGGEHARRAFTEERVERLVADAMPAGRTRDWYGALMDFGSLVCAARDPKCASCPLRASCAAAPSFLRGAAPKRALRKPQAKFEGSFRQRRGAVLKALVGAGKRGMTVVALVRTLRLSGVPAAVRELQDEGLVLVRKDVVRLP